MSPFSILPAAPAPEASGPDLRDFSSKTPRPIGSKEQGEPSFEDALTRSSGEDKPRESSESPEEAVALAGTILPAPLLQLPPDLQAPELHLTLETLTTGIVADGALPAEPLPVEIGTPGDWLNGLNPTPEQPVPISKPLVQSVYNSTAEFSPVPVAVASNMGATQVLDPAVEKSQTLAAPSPVLAEGVELAVTENPVPAEFGKPVSDFSGGPQELDPANLAALANESETESGPEQITDPRSGLNLEGAAKTASGVGSQLVQPPSAGGGERAGAGKRPISGAKTAAGTGGAGAERVMSAALLQSSRAANSQKIPGEPVGVFGGIDAEDEWAAGDLGELFGAADLSRSVEMGSKVPDLVSIAPAQSSQTPAPSSAAPATAAHLDAARVLEHLEATFAKYRPNVPPHLEVKVDLQGGDTLQVRLDLRGDALQSTFRTDSPELRLALQRAWPEFAERSQQQGLNLSPASFDSPGMSSDTGSQADGRRSGAQESEGPLPEAFRKAPNQFSKKTGEPAQGPRESARTRWA